MKIYDYSNLLTVIDKLDTEKEKVILEKNSLKTTYLDNLENKLFASGMLGDWRELIKVMKKVKVRGCPYPVMLPGKARFEDNHRFVYTVNSGSSGYRCDYLALMYGDSESPNAPSYYQWSAGYGSEKKIDIFATYGNDPVMREIEVKTTLIEEFMGNYPKYREIKLKEIYEKIGQKSEEVEKLRKEL